MTKSEAIPCKPGFQSIHYRDDPDHQGVLWVKLPPGNRSGGFKAWSKRQVTIKEDFVAKADCVASSLLIMVHKSDKTAANDETPETDLIFKKWFDPNKTVLFRCKSKTQQYGFTMCLKNAPLIHFASISETEAQRWMYNIRTILWPPSAFVQLERTLGSIFEVSIIDNEFSHRAGLLGAYGHLKVASKKVTLSHPQTGHVIQEWYLNTVGFKQLVQSHAQDDGKVINMVTDSKSSTGYGNVILFCPHGRQLLDQVHEVRQMFLSDSYGEGMKRELSSQLTNDGTGSLADSFSKYQKPKDSVKVLSSSHDVYESPTFTFNRSLSGTFVDTDGEQLSKSLSTSPAKGSNSKGVTRRVKTFGWKNHINIPESMLDSSMSSSMMRTPSGRPNSSSSTSSSEGSSPSPKTNKLDIYMGNSDIPISQQSCIEEEEDMYDEIHKAIVEGQADIVDDEHDSDGQASIPAEVESDQPPPLPEKKRKSLIASKSSAELSAESN
ncbi:hypothetical protein HDE_00319 [Halotydeus destructor]|nr:hypothetical protein HDE_00319 [Halotydeus destructor]